MDKIFEVILGFVQEWLRKRVLKRARIQLPDGAWMSPKEILLADEQAATQARLRQIYGLCGKGAFCTCNLDPKTGVWEVLPLPKTAPKPDTRIDDLSKKVDALLKVWDVK